MISLIVISGRSVLLADKLYAYFHPHWRNVQIRHRELGPINASSIDEPV